MKTIIKLTFVLALAMSVSSAFALGNLTTKIEPLNGKKALVSVSSLLNSDINLTITDNSDQIIYRGEVNKLVKDYSNIFDFSQLEDGDYQLKVESAQLTTIRTFSKNYNEINIGEEKTSMKPYFEYKDGLLRLTYLNFNQEELELSVFEGDNLIYTKKIEPGFTVNEALKIKGDYKSSFTTVLSAGKSKHYFENELNRDNLAFVK